MSLMNSPGQKSNKTVLITGSSRGIGLRIAEIFAKKKYNIIICSRNSLEIKKAERKIKSYGVSCLALKVDISDFSKCEFLVKKAIKKFSRIDVLVNNAGVQGPVNKTWLVDAHKWIEAVKINLLGTFFMCRLVVPYMVKQNSGIVINVSGGGSVYPRPYFSAYSTSKAAILRLTETLSLELKGKKVFVFAVGPGLTWTKMTRDIFKNKKLFLDKNEIEGYKNVIKTGGTPVLKMEELINFLLNKKSRKFSGRLLHVNELQAIKKAKYRIKKQGGFLRRVEFFD